MLPFHKLGAPKYAKLGIPFPLADTPAPSEELSGRSARGSRLGDRVAIMALLDVPVASLPPEPPACLARRLARFEQTIARGRELLGGGTLWTVNSTAFGGGVAETLPLVGYVRGGLDMRWVVMEGDPEFFRVTKRLHNRLHGAEDEPLGPAEHAVYERCCARNADALAARIRSVGATAILLHDPQTAGMIPQRGSWVCR